MSSYNINEALYFNLKLLEFEKYLRTSPFDVIRAIDFVPSLFEKHNVHAFEAVSHFILAQLRTLYKSDKYVAALKPCFPSRDKKQESDFRKIITEFFASIENVKDFHNGQKTPYSSILQTGGDKFIILYLRLSTLLTIRIINPSDRAAIRTIKDPKEADKFRVTHLDKLDKIRSEVAQRKQVLKNGQKVLEDQASELSSTLSELQESNKSFCESILRSLRCEDLAPTMVNVRSEVENWNLNINKKSESLERKIAGLKISATTQDAMGPKLPQVCLPVGDMVKKLEQSEIMAQQIEEQLSEVPTRELVNLEQEATRADEKSRNIVQELEEIKDTICPNGTLVDPELDELFEKVQEIPEVRDMYQSIREMLPPRLPVIKLEPKKSDRFRGSWKHQPQTATVVKEEAGSEPVSDLRVSDGNISADISCHLDTSTAQTFNSNSILSPSFLNSSNVGIMETSSSALDRISELEKE